MHTRFDDIRPYLVSEIPEAMKRIADSEFFPAIARFVFPDLDVKDAQKILKGYNNVYDFQTGAMYKFLEQVIAQTVTKFTYSGLEHLDRKKSYLFISNHRDIVLDSMLLQYILYNNGFSTTEITFGSNLMSSQLIIDIGRSNKMFKVVRGETARDFYKTSLHLSEYIRHAIAERNESIWIAQRSGRTKDGNDVTEQGIIKMFCMSGGKNIVQALHSLNITPISISYQHEPCDYLKTREVYLSRNGEKYIKTKDEDLISILTGIMQFKGNIHLTVCKPIEEEELQLAKGEQSSNDFYKHAVNIINKRIYKNYQLHDTNYIAHDIRSKTNSYADYYNPQSKEKFLQKYNQILDKFDTDKEIINSIFLGIYANSVDNVMCERFFCCNKK